MEGGGRYFKLLYEIWDENNLLDVQKRSQSVEIVLLVGPMAYVRHQYFVEIEFAPIDV